MRSSARQSASLSSRAASGNEHITAAIEATGGLEYTARLARTEVDAALSALREVPESQYSRALRSLATFAVERSYDQLCSRYSSSRNRAEVLRSAVTCRDQPHLRGSSIVVPTPQETCMRFRTTIMATAMLAAGVALAEATFRSFPGSTPANDRATHDRTQPQR